MSPKLLSAALFGIAVSLPIAFLLLLIGCTVANTATDPKPLIALLPYAALLIGAFLSGALSCRKSGERPFLCSGIAGGGYALILLLIGLFLGSDGFLFSLLAAVILTAIAISGGYLFRPRIPSAKKRRAALMKSARGRS